jgi:hypothetical protein
MEEKMCIKSSVLAVGCVLTMIATGVFAQTSGTNKKEMTVEESYLQESVELMVIREESRADSRDMKMVALEYIGDAISAGRMGPDIQQALDYLALEGIVNFTREGGTGRITNNYPDVRMRAAYYLGELGTEEAKSTLIKLVLAENEPMVITEAIKALTKVPDDENDDVVTAISWVVTRFDIINPDNLLALSALEAYEKIAEQNDGLNDPNAIRTIIRIAEGSYIQPVKARALETLNNLRKYNSSSSSTKNSGNTTQK